jgi:hypothetical protein
MRRFPAVASALGRRSPPDRPGPHPGRQDVSGRQLLLVGVVLGLVGSPLGVIRPGDDMCGTTTRGPDR